MGRGYLKLWLPLLACLLLTLACGVPIPVEHQEATATAERLQREQASEPGSSDSVRQLAVAGLQVTAGDDTAASGAPAELLAPRDATRPDPEETQAGAADDAQAAEADDETATEQAEPVETPQPQALDVSAAVSPADLIAEALAILNEVRVSRGLRALLPDASIEAKAGGYASYMAANNYFGHYGLDGSSPDSRLAAAGYTGLYKGETLTAGHASARGAVNALLASPRHAEILLDPLASEVGVGYAYGAGSTYKHYWVVVTGGR